MKVDRKILAGQSLFPLMVLLGLAALVYTRTFGATWTYDDFPVIVDNPDIRSIGAFLKNSYPGRPLREITYLLDYALFGYQPAGWHLQQIFWHGLNGWLVFRLATALQLNRFGRWCAALLFLLHPLQVEVVANLSHRKDALATACCLVGILAYLRYFHGRQWRWLLVAAVAWGLGLAAKQTAVVLPLLFLAYEAVFLPPAQRLLLRRWWPWLTLLALAGAGVGAWFFFFGGLAEYTQAWRGLLVAKSNYFGPAALFLYPLVMIKSWAFMALKLFWPQQLALEYTIAVPGGMTDPFLLGGCLGLFVLVGVFFWSWRHCRSVFFGLSWACFFWVPVSNLWPLVYLAADRYWYTPMAGLALVAGHLAGRLPDRWWRWTGTAIVLMVFGILSWQQTAVWKNPEALWTNAYHVNPNSTFTLNNLGNVNLLKGDLIAARRFYTESVALNPTNGPAHFNLGIIFEQQGELDGALAHYQQFLRLDSPLYRNEAATLRRRLALQYGVRLN
ncbi:membrane protein [Desulfuromonas sp. DDH964]|uniref:tetratricopeptide repeat protein n=1 Tax=Desulfuromonas sp. DDH964 TaxID=1823759 RepID=UPI00078E3CA7|nr:tetratricopeptide repeat protein [Desulfuromonas sp. DDH964]AMV73139.1 membrane protein [Desulfuromonas sp. DDH964]